MANQQNKNPFSFSNLINPFRNTFNPIKPQTGQPSPLSTTLSAMRSASSPTQPQPNASFPPQNASFPPSGQITSPFAFTGAVPQVNQTQVGATPPPATATPAQPTAQTVEPRTPSGLTLSEAMALQNANQATPATPQISPETTQGGTSTPQVPQVPPETIKAVQDAEQAIQASLKISSGELSTQEDLDRLIESTKTAFQNTTDQPIPLEFITGQLKSIENRALNLAEPLERKLARLQAQRQASLESSEFALDRADKKAEIAKGARDETKDEIQNIASSLLSAGATQEQIRQITQSRTTEQALEVAATTGLFTPTSDGEGFTLGNNQTRFNSKGEVVATTIGLDAGSGSPQYTLGENPVVDGWVQNINEGRATLANVPNEIKNQVSQALVAGGASTNPAKVAILQDKIRDIETLKKHRGLSKSVGPSGLGRFTPFKIDTWTGDVQDFVASVHQLTSKETLQFLIDVKSAGATFGALSNQELQVLAESATKLNDWEIKKDGEPTGKWNIDESSFKRELGVIQTIAERALARSIGEEAPPEDPVTGGFQNNIVTAPDGTEVEIID